MSIEWEARRSGSTPQRQHGQHRDPFQRDRARIIHSAAFRSLQTKTQVLGTGDHDFYRTRLTHSLEVAQIGTGITAYLRSCTIPDAIRAWIPNDNLMETICLAHDIGHPPFGHGGEVALNFLLQQHGGFEGNAQSFRIISKLGDYSDVYGMDLTRRSMLGIIKYPNTLDNLGDISLQPSYIAADCKPPKGIYSSEQEILDWVLAPFSQHDQQTFIEYTKLPHQTNHTLYKAFDTTIMEMADDIAYGVHDLEDAITLGFIDSQTWQKKVLKTCLAIDNEWIHTHFEDISENLFSHKKHLRKDAIGALVSWFITSIYITQLNKFDHPLLDIQVKLPEEIAQALTIFKQFSYNEVILKPQVQTNVFRGQEMLMRIFKALIQNPFRLLPVAIQEELKQTDTSLYMRTIADYLAALSDGEATRLYQRLFIPSSGSIFDRI